MAIEAQQALERAMKHERNGDDEAALGAYLDAIEADPESVDIAYLTARALLKVGFLEEARSQLRRIVFIEPDHVKAKASLGNCHLLLGDDANAETAFRDVLEVSPDNQNALYGLASLHLKNEKFEEARILSEKLLKLTPKSAAAFTLFAQSFGADPHSSQAAAAFRKALTFDQDYTPALMGLARLAMLRHKFTEAETLSQKAARLNPSNSEPLRLLADALAGQKRYDDSRSALISASQLPDADKTAILLEMSALARRQGERHAALNHAYEAWKLQKDIPAAGNAIGACLKKLGLVGEAKLVLTAISNNASIPEQAVTKIESLIKDAEVIDPLPPMEPSEEPAADTVHNEKHPDV
ncbi:MAG: tetratricopeptide repeat protein [Flavobacteriaceae bacterium]|nr:tetratricopeptide repeat protein [Flavobacteriaceae bacterium]